MVAHPSMLAIVSVILPLLSATSATLTQELSDRKLPDCDASIKFNDIEDKGTFWYDSGAEQFASDYIDSNTDHTTWAQNLLIELLPGKTHTLFDCRTPDANCQVDVTCGDFNAINKGGLYYLYVSLMNYHKYMQAMQTQMNLAFQKSALNVGTMVQLLNIPDGQENDSPDVLSILSYAASMGAGFVNPAFQGTIGAISGVFGIVSVTAPSNTPVKMDDKAEAAISGMILDAIDTTNSAISRLVAAVFGKFGQSQDAIPEEMRRGGVSNPAVQVMGWGDWLRDDANTQVAKDLAGNIKEKFDQSLLWQMARLFKRTYVVVRSDLPVDKCTNPNNAWDEENSRCLDLLSWDGSVSSTLGGANDLTANDMWGSWNMDPYYTMRNAVDCWEDHDGHIGDAEPRKVWKSDVPPPCFFAMQVVKGSYSDSHKGMIELDDDFPGQIGLKDKMWPKSKCKDASEFERGANDCDYSWVGDE